jgi:hypothetical protein
LKLFDCNLVKEFEKGKIKDDFRLLLRENCCEELRRFERWFEMRFEIGRW